MSTKKNNEQQSIQEALVDLYLNVKVRSKDEIAKYTKDHLADERTGLEETDCYALIGYIKTSIEILMTMKVDDYLYAQKGKKANESFRSLNSSAESAGVEPPKDYEDVIIKLEADIR